MAILDVLVAGGGPFGTAAAFRATELGLSVLVIDYDDLMKRIRDYAKDKLILPDFGGGDQMQFPKGGPLISSLQFGPIDKDALCAAWKALYKQHNVPAEIGLEMTGLTREGDCWRVVTWNHTTRAEQSFVARHVVLGFGRGVPRRIDVTGDVQGMAFSLTDGSRYVGEPACVIGGGTSAAEAVIAISNAKVAASDASEVFWSYRGDKMPKVSKALADVFFDAFMGNGNIRYLAKSEPISVTGHGEEAYLAVRTSRRQVAGQPTECTQLEFRTYRCLACIGEDIPEALLTKVGVPLVTGGPSNKKRIVVSPLLETRQPNVYLAGDVLSPAYLETRDFDGDPGAFGELKRRGNIKSAMRDGVLIAEVIHQKMSGRTNIEVSLEFVEAPAPASQPAMAASPGPSAEPPTGGGAARAPEPSASPAAQASDCALVAVLPSGLEANEYRIKRDGVTVIGRQGADLVFTDDPLVADRHASIVAGDDGYRVRDEGSTRGTYLRPTAGRLVSVDPGAILKAGNQWLLIGDPRNPGALLHFDSAGHLLARFFLKEGTSVLGREAPDITLAAADSTLSRRHFAVVRRNTQLSVRDLGSANGTLIKVTGSLPLVDGDRLIVGQQVLRFSDDRVAARPKSAVRHNTTGHGEAAPPARATADERLRAAAPPAAPVAPAPSAPARAPAPAASTEPSVFVSGANRRVTCKRGQTICEALEAGGVKIDADCHQGSCGMDPVQILEGAQHLNPISGTERGTLEDLCSVEPGKYRLACVARVSGPVSIEIVKSRK